MPPVPRQQVLIELDSHGMTPESAPATWEFLGECKKYYDVVNAIK